MWSPTLPLSGDTEALLPLAKWLGGPQGFWYSTVAGLGPTFSGTSWGPKGVVSPGAACDHCRRSRFPSP